MKHPFAGHIAAYKAPEEIELLPSQLCPSVARH
jgi:hypothetical protein